MIRAATIILVVLGLGCAPLAAQDPVSFDLLQRLSTGPVAVSLEPPAVGRATPPEVTAQSVAAFFYAAWNVQRQDHALVGAVVSVVYRGEVLFKRGYGWADLDRRVPADPDGSLFRIASISKAFVWTALMQLVEQRLIELDAPVDRYLDFELPATYVEPIRVWHLLTHTAGFEETWLGWGARDVDDIRDLGAQLQNLMPARVRPPGEHASYSNYGAALAGYIVAQLSGQTWDDYVTDHILLPLGMSSTNAHNSVRTELMRRHAKGYVYHAGEFIPTPFSFMQLGAAGQMSSTASDMATFMLAHLNHGALGDSRILEESTSRLMQSPLFAPDPELPPLLHGFYRSDRNGQIVFGHGGDTNQFHSSMSMLPEHDLGVFVSFNSDPGAAARSKVAVAFIDHFFPPAGGPPSPEPVDVDLSDYAGEYIPLRSAFSTFERLRVLSSTGCVQAEGAELRVNGKLPLVATSKDHFTSRYEDLVFVFERDADGEVTHLMAGSPLGTLRRVRGLQAPGTIKILLNLTMLIALAAVLGWGYRIFRPVPEEKRLFSPDVRLAWLHAALLLGFLYVIPTAAGNIIFGMPASLHALLLGFNANLVLGLVVIGLNCRQWVGLHGTIGSRSRYSLFALAAAFNLWFAWSFNLVAWAF